MCLLGKCASFLLFYLQKGWIDQTLTNGNRSQTNTFAISDDDKS